MKAITIHQPWAYAVAHLGKDVENRRWSYKGGVLAVHAGQGWAAEGAAFIAKLGLTLPPSMPKGVIVAVVNVAEVHHAYRCKLECSQWSMPELHHWFLTDVRVLAEPVPCRGAQGIWTVPDDKAALVRQQLGERHHEES